MSDLQLSPPSSVALYPFQLEAFGISDVGVARVHNEDHFAVLPHLGLYLVADGMGGHAGGEVAARAALDSIRAAFEDTDMTWPTIARVPSRLPGLDRLVEGVELANARVFAASARDRDLRGMGTTVVGALACGDKLAIAHVGDSRLYRWRELRLDALTEDHSLVNEYIRSGVLKPEDAPQSRFRNVITRSVGTHAQVDVEARIVDMQPGDTYMLCSDGLCGVLSPEEMTAILRAEPDLCRAAWRLVERANDLGGPDNITVVLLRVSALLR